MRNHMDHWAEKKNSRRDRYVIPRLEIIHNITLTGFRIENN